MQFCTSVLSSNDAAEAASDGPTAQLVSGVDLYADALQDLQRMACLTRLVASSLTVGPLLL